MTAEELQEKIGSPVWCVTAPNPYDGDMFELPTFRVGTIQRLDRRLGGDVTATITGVGWHGSRSFKTEADGVPEVNNLYYDSLTFFNEKQAKEYYLRILNVLEVEVCQHLGHIRNCRANMKNSMIGA